MLPHDLSLTPGSDFCGAAPCGLSQGPHFGSAPTGCGSVNHTDVWAGIVQAPANPRLIKGGMPIEASVASVIVSKYADHLPLYRQAQIYARQGVYLDRSTLAAWGGKAAYELRPVYDCLLENLKQSTKLFIDECLNETLFSALADAKETLDVWQEDYNRYNHTHRWKT